MPKIVYAPILEQAGFLKRKAAAVVEQWVAQLDGAIQCWQFTVPISLVASDVVEFEFVGFENSGTYKRFFGSTDFVLGLDTGASGSEFRLNRIEYATLDSEAIGNGTLIPNRGKLVCSVTESRDINTLGSIGETRNIRAAIYNFKVIRNGTVIHEIRLNNKAQGATQLATVGNVNAFMANYTDAVWRKP